MKYGLIGAVEVLPFRQNTFAFWHNWSIKSICQIELKVGSLGIGFHWVWTAVNPYEIDFLKIGSSLEKIKICLLCPMNLLYGKQLK